LRWLAHCPLLLGAGNDRRDCDRRGLRDVILYGEDVRYIAVVAFRPDMIACLCFDKLRGDSDAVAGFSQPALKHIANAQFAADLFHVYRASLEGKRRIAGDDEE
jgi:hypothetical protein